MHFFYRLMSNLNAINESSFKCKGLLFASPEWEQDQFKNFSFSDRQTYVAAIIATLFHHWATQSFN